MPRDPKKFFLGKEFKNPFTYRHLKKAFAEPFGHEQPGYLGQAEALGPPPETNCLSYFPGPKAKLLIEIEPC